MTAAVDFKAKQLEFTRYIRNPAENPPPPDVNAERVAMYRELIFNNIDSFLANNFPVIRTILGDADWYALIQDFFVKHTCHTPYFSEIAEEFLNYLQNERAEPSDYPFLLELAHYEWVEMALSIAKEDIPPNDFPEADLSACTVNLSPLAWPLIYRFPVQQISPDYLPAEAPGEPTCLIAYRDPADEVKFVEINAMTYRMLEIIQENEGVKIDACLRSLAAESGHPNPQTIITGGLAILRELAEKHVIIAAAAG